MRAALSLGLLSSALLAGCTHPPSGPLGGLNLQRSPQVVIESIVEADGSPSRGYPISPLPMPLYPFELVRAGISGQVDVKLVVGITGEVKQATIVKSTQKDFEPYVLAAVKQWRFRAIPVLPATPPNELVEVCRFRFSIEEG